MNTPPEIVATLNQHVNAALADAAFKAQLAKLGLGPFASTPTEFAKFIAAETEKWGKVIRTAGIKAISPYTGWKWARWPSGDVGWLPSDIELPLCLRVAARNDIQ